MSYVALYRKWRPGNFDEVKGQDHIVSTLRNQILGDKVGHAYLFCGTRGTGKTTVAKILAGAVNCESPVNGNPCGKCASCKAIAAGSSFNVIEIDAASNNGVDNIRQIREEVEYRPTEGKYKVYIIDEVHMLSSGAFNALLKTLEEPPSYVMFILATTEVHKLPVTIISRCQRYDFKRIPIQVIKDRLTELTAAENTPVEDKALSYIARLADGAMRDALSLLDRCIAVSPDGSLGYEQVLDILGNVDTAVFSKMYRLVQNSQVAGIIKTLEELLYEGRDIGQFVSDFAWYIRNIMMLKVSDEAKGMLDMSVDNMARLEEEAASSDTDTLMRYIRILSELSNSLRNSSQKRLLTEVALIRMTRPQMEKDINSLSERIKRLEELVQEKEDILSLVAIRPEIPIGVSYEEATRKPKVKPQIPALSEDIENLVKHWNGILGQLDEPVKAFITGVRLTAEDDTLVICCKDDVQAGFILNEKNSENLRNIMESTIGKSVKFRVVHLQEKENFDDKFVDIENLVNMDIDYDDTDE